MIMDTFDVYDIRKVPLTDIVRQKNYLDLVPRPTPEEYNRLKESIKRDGLEPTKPFVANETSMVLLDGYTRIQIAEELGLEWGYVTFRDFEDHLEEKLFIINHALERRHLNKPQKAELVLKGLEFEKDRAKARQRQAGEQIGKLNLKQVEKDQENEGDNSHHQLPPNSGEAGHPGEAIKILARMEGIGHDTLYRTQKITQAAKTDPEIAEAWDKAKQGQGSVNSVYQQVKAKVNQNGNGEAKKRPKVVFAKIKSWKEEREEHRKRLEAKEQRYLVPREELVETLREAARLKQMPMDAVEALMESDPQFIQVWKHMRMGVVTLTVGWCVINWKIHVWFRARQGMEPSQEYRRMIALEMKKSYLVLLMRVAMNLREIPSVSDVAIEFVTGIDRKLFPYMEAWSDRLDLLAEHIRLRPRFKPEVLEKAMQLWKQGKKDAYRNLLTMTAMGDFRKKLDKEMELERQSFGRS